MESWPGLQIGDGLRVSLGVMLGRLFALFVQLPLSHQLTCMGRSQL